MLQDGPERINSAASYRLDHAPVAESNISHQKDLVYGTPGYPRRAQPRCQKEVQGPA